MPKSKSTKSHEISRKTKEKVWERQHGRSLFPPFMEITVDMCCCHYIPRSRGGVGEEWNVFGCYQSDWLDEHRLFDQHKLPNAIVMNHLIDNYQDWSIDACVFHKWYEEQIKLIRKEK